VREKKQERPARQLRMKHVRMISLCGVVAVLAAWPLSAQSDSIQLLRAERIRIAQEKLLNDWADLAHFRTANESLGAPKKGERRVVFIGDSITELWAPLFPALFPGKPYVGRGISGQTTPQILVRFRQDVVALKPKVVVILAGTNDIAGNTGPSSLKSFRSPPRSSAIGEWKSR
jgi:hypothetical protein